MIKIRFAKDVLKDNYPLFWITLQELTAIDREIKQIGYSETDLGLYMEIYEVLK